MEKYYQLKQHYQTTFEQLTKRSNRFSMIRLGIIANILLSIYLYIDSPSLWIVLNLIASSVGFMILVVYQDKADANRQYFQRLLSVNEDEILYKEKKVLSFENGDEFRNPAHFYTWDLDIFGQNSLFQHLNRTGTVVGKQKLAGLLQQPIEHKQIIENQEAVKTLGNEIEWRQSVRAIASMVKENANDYQKLLHWSKQTATPLPDYLLYIALISSVLTIGAAAVSAWTDNNNLFLMGTALFWINVLVAFSKVKQMKNDLQTLEKNYKTIAVYSKLLAKIESFETDNIRINHLKSQIKTAETTASEQINVLSNLLDRMNQINNVMAVIFVNGFLLYHLHVYQRLLKWRKQYAIHIEKWLEVIGEIETLCSLANFYAHNAHFCFPTINHHYQLDFENLGHPLIDERVRICNNVSFSKHRFVIMTGSNMSGKSTFLRTLGVNMVLANMGAPVCATKADVHILNVLVSMRLSDSLSDNQSYFFAEVNRLKEIMNQLDKEKSFVLLDEILRGTNSDDKQFGTIAVIKKMVEKEAIGAIATHDLEVCLTTNDYPNVLANKCFEVEIKDNDLYFDYQLREGICKNKSATFLMQKLGVIE